MKISVDSKFNCKIMQTIAIINILVVSIVISSILTMHFNKVYAESDISTEIKIGIYFNDKSKGISKAVSYFNVYADKGLVIGCQNDKDFTVLAQVNSNNKLKIRKDDFFNEENIGPFHVKIGNDYSSYNDIASKIKEFKSNGVNAYPSYDNGNWSIMSGFYLSENLAKEDIDNIYSKKFLNTEFAIVQGNNKSIVVTSNSNGNMNDVIGLFKIDNAVLQIKPAKENNPFIFNLDGKNYRGFIEVSRLNESDMTVANVLSIEEYLYGVVPCEIEYTSNYEALKAQAVASRTYAIKNLGEYSKLGFDLCNTVYSQVYKGFDYEREITNKAVDDTKGEILYYDNDIAQVFYFSSSGGKTEAAKNVWSYDAPYLQIVDDNYEEENSTNYFWERSLTYSDLNNILISRGNNIGDICGIKIINRSDAGRPIKIIIMGTKGEVVLEKARCRDVFGLPSQWYDITTDAEIAVFNTNNETIEKSQLAGMKFVSCDYAGTIETGKDICILGAGGNKKTIPSAPNIYTFTGKGYGHAVGMSQEGAKGMANAGFLYDEILYHYFPGTTIKCIY